MPARDGGVCEGSILSRRIVLVASTALAAASALAFVALTPMIAAQAQPAQSAITEQEAHAIAVDAYLYLYPLVSIDITRRVGINVEAGKIPGFGPANMFHSFSVFPPQTSKRSFARISIRSIPAPFST